MRFLYWHHASWRGDTPSSSVANDPVAGRWQLYPHRRRDGSARTALAIRSPSLATHSAPAGAFGRVTFGISGICRVPTVAIDGIRRPAPGFALIVRAQPSVWA